MVRQAQGLGPLSQDDRMETSDLFTPAPDGRGDATLAVERSAIADALLVLNHVPPGDVAAMNDALKPTPTSP